MRHFLATTDHSIVNVDKLTYAANLNSLAGAAENPNYRFERVDICDRNEIERVFREHQPDKVMHLAAESHVDRSIDGPGEFIQTNIVGTQILLDTATQYWRALDPDRGTRFRFHHVSTDEVFGSLGGRRFVYRIESLRSKFALCGEQGLVGPSRARLEQDIRVTGGAQQYVEQLWALSVSRKIDPFDNFEGRRR